MPRVRFSLRTFLVALITATLVTSNFFTSCPYSDLSDLDQGTLRRLYLDTVQPVEFGHTLADQIGGQLDMGFVLTGMNEDRFDGATGGLLSHYMDSFVATRAIKPCQA